MAAEVNSNYFAWSPEEPAERDGSQGVSVAQMLEHGSISFGKFKFEALSWEKWSVFTQDRRQEELEKINGLVSEKKAFFEDYYRQMRALKALQHQEERQQQQLKLQRQQTEMTLDYGDEGSSSSQAEEAGPCNDVTDAALPVTDNRDAGFMKDDAKNADLGCQPAVLEAEQETPGNNEGVLGARADISLQYYSITANNAFTEEPIEQAEMCLKNQADENPATRTTKAFAKKSSSSKVVKKKEASEAKQTGLRPQSSTRTDKVPSARGVKPPPPPPRLSVARSNKRATKEMPGVTTAARRPLPDVPQRKGQEKHANASTLLRPGTREGRAGRPGATKAEHTSLTGAQGPPTRRDAPPAMQGASNKRLVPVIVRSDRTAAKRHIEEAERGSMTPGRYYTSLKKNETERVLKFPERPSTGSKMTGTENTSKAATRPSTGSKRMGAGSALYVLSRPSTTTKTVDVFQRGKVKTSSLNLPSRREPSIINGHEQRSFDCLMLSKRPLAGNSVNPGPAERRTVIAKNTASVRSETPQRRGSKVSTVRPSGYSPRTPSKPAQAVSTAVQGTKTKAGAACWR